MLLKKPNLLYGALLFWLIVGLVLRLDYKSYGYISGLDIVKFGQNPFSFAGTPGFTLQMLLFTLSALLITSSWLASNILLIRTLLITETGIWLVKLFFFKDGYISGFVGVPDEEVVFYDFIALFLRALLLLRVLNVKFNWLRIGGAIAFSIICILLKSSLFNHIQS